MTLMVSKANLILHAWTEKESCITITYICIHNVSLTVVGVTCFTIEPNICARYCHTLSQALTIKIMHANMYYIIIATHQCIHVSQIHSFSLLYPSRCHRQNLDPACRNHYFHKRHALLIVCMYSTKSISQCHVWWYNIYNVMHLILINSSL